MSQVNKPETIAYRELLKKHDRKPLNEEEMDTEVDVYGAVLKIYPVEKSLSGNKDYKIKLTITDPSVVNGERGSITALIFRTKPEELELIKEYDIIVFKNAKIGPFGGRQVLARPYAPIAIYPSNELEPKNDVSNVGLYDFDVEIVQHLNRWHQSFISNSNVQIALPPKGRPLLETAEIYTTSGMFFDYVGLAVAFKDDNRDDVARYVQVLLTDYTKNPYPPSADRDDNLNIGNDHLIYATLWDENVDTCPPVQPGDYIHLRNCRKNIRENVLEIRVGADGGKTMVTKLDENDKRLKEMIERRQNHISPTDRRRTEIKAYPLRTNVIDLQNFTPIEKILQQKGTGSYLTRAFISDYKPKDISKWIKSWCSKCLKSSGKISLPCVQCGGITETMFKFALLVEDEKEVPILLYAFKETASFLFPGFSAEDVYHDKKVFKQLKRIIKLASDKTEKVYLDIGLESYSSQAHPEYHNYMIKNTQFLLDED